MHFGHPNLARARAGGDCGVEGVYVDGEERAPGVEEAVRMLPSSSDGLVEYVSWVFGGEKRGVLMVC